MDSSFLENNTMDNEMRDNILLAIRLYEMNKDIKLLKKILDILGIETGFKNQIIQSTLDIVGV